MFAISKTIDSVNMFVNAKYICMHFRTTESNSGKIPKAWWATDEMSAGHVLTCLL